MIDSQVTGRMLACRDYMGTPQAKPKPLGLESSHLRQFDYSRRLINREAAPLTLSPRQFTEWWFQCFPGARARLRAIAYQQNEETQEPYQTLPVHLQFAPMESYRSTIRISFEATLCTN